MPKFPKWFLPPWIRYPLELYDFLLPYSLPGQITDFDVPAGWQKDCGPVGQIDYGWGSGMVNTGSCPGGVCDDTFYVVPQSGYAGGSIPLTNGTQKRSVIIGALNALAAAGNPAGRMTMFMKICRVGSSSPTPEYAEPIYNNPPKFWAPPQPRPRHPPWPWVPYLPPEWPSQKGPKTRQRPRPRPDAPPKRPGPRVTEKKVCSAWLKGLLALWGAATEVPDWTEAVYESLPKSVRNKCKARTVDEKWLCFLRNEHKVDKKKLLENILKNVTEDAIAGWIIQKLKEAGIGTTFNGGLYVIDPSKSC